MKSKKVLGRCLLVLLCIVAAIAIAGVAQFYHRSDPKNRKQYDTTNPFITGTAAIDVYKRQVSNVRTSGRCSSASVCQRPTTMTSYGTLCAAARCSK